MNAHFSECVMKQAWSTGPDAGFPPATVKAGWDRGSLLVFVSLDDKDICSDAAENNLRMP